MSLSYYPPLQPGTTYRTPCGRGRSTYSPSWSGECPWSVVVDGTVLFYVRTLRAAQQIFERRGIAI